MWEFWLSLATIILSSIAIIINIYQNRKIKKQNLFDRRLRLYLELMDIWNLYKTNISFLDNLDPMSIDIVFSYITNSSKLYMLTDIMKNPLDHTKKAIFLTSCENLRKDAQEFRLIFKEKYKKCADFIEAYVNMMQQFHRQQILIKHYEKKEKVTLNHMQNECNKLANKELIPSINRIKDIFNEIEKEKLLNKIEKEIKF